MGQIRTSTRLYDSRVRDSLFGDGSEPIDSVTPGCKPYTKEDAPPMHHMGVEGLALSLPRNI